jgi:hypothetical protein
MHNFELAPVAVTISGEQWYQEWIGFDNEMTGLVVQHSIGNARDHAL